MGGTHFLLRERQISFSSCLCLLLYSLSIHVQLCWSSLSDKDWTSKLSNYTLNYLGNYINNFFKSPKRNSHVQSSTGS